MKKSKRLQILVDLAKDKEDKVAQVLAGQRNTLEAEKAKLIQLEEYAKQYESERNLLGMNSYLTTNYYHFVDRLGQAIQQQKNVIKRVEQQIELTMKRWLELRGKSRSMEWLQQKNVNLELAIEAKQEQKQSDEFAMRRSLGRIR